MKSLRIAAMLMAVAAGPAFAALGIGATAWAEEDTSFAIATGRVGGLYHPVGGAICELFNKRGVDQKTACTVDITSGAVENLKKLRDGTVTMAMAQSDLARDALNGTDVFKEDGPFEALRSVFAVYVESVTIVAPADKEITKFDDLKGKRVFLDRHESGRRHEMDVLMEAYGWVDDSIEAVSEYKAENLAAALCDGEFDAWIETAGHPNPITREVSNSCDVVFVPMTGSVIDTLVADDPAYVASIIPENTYRGQSGEIATLGVVATLVTTAGAPAALIYDVTKDVFEFMRSAKKLPPIFAMLTPNEKTTAGVIAPLHDGALEYFSEAGLE